MLKTLFVACLAALTKVTRIKTALAVVHARIHPSVHPRGRCERASYLMRSPAYPLYVKPLHCSTASGISAGTALFFSLHHPHNRQIKFGPDPSCGEPLTHTCTLPGVACYALENQGQLRPPPQHPASFQILMEPLFAPHEYPPPLHEWDSCWSTCLGNRQRKMKHEVLEGSAVQTPSSRLRCNLFKAETFLFAGAAATPLNETGHLESMRQIKSILYCGGQHSDLYFGIWMKKRVCWFE